MSEKLGFYELLEPYFALRLTAENVSGTTLRDVRDNLLSAGGTPSGLGSSLPSVVSTLSSIVTGLLDYLSVEELHSTFDQDAVIYRGSAKFGGEGRANPEPPVSQSITSASGQQLSWQDDMLAFRLTVPRSSQPLQFDTDGLSEPDRTDLSQLNSLLSSFDVDGPGTNFRLELLIRTVKLVLPRDDFIPARMAADGWLEPDPSLQVVVLEFPRLAFVLEQQGQVGNLDLTLKSWDSAGFDDPGDVDTARFFTLTPPLFLHSSRVVGFGVERLVADFSDNVTPSEILEQFGIGDEFNGFWLPLVQVFIAPGRTTGLAMSARGKDLLFDFDKGFSGELALDILNRGGQLSVEPVFYRPQSKTPLELNRGSITRHNDGTTEVSEGDVIIPGGDGELHLSIRGSISPYQVTVKFGNTPLLPDLSAGQNRPKWRFSISGVATLDITVTDNGGNNSWHETIKLWVGALPSPSLDPINEPDYDLIFEEDAAGDPGYRIILDEEQSKGKNLVVRLTPDVPTPVLRVGTQVFTRRPDGTYFMVLTPNTAPAKMVATWDVSAGAPPVERKLFFRLEYPLKPDVLPQKIGEDFEDGLPNKNIGLSPETLGQDTATIRAALQEFLAKTTDPISVDGFASFERTVLAPFDQKLSERRADALAEILKLLPNGRPVNSKTGHGHAADDADKTNTNGDIYRYAVATAAPLPVNKTRFATAFLKEKPRQPIADTPVEHPPTATEPERPPIFRRIGFRVRFERNQLVLGEISGELDFHVQAEETAGFIKTNDPRNSDGSSLADTIKTPPEASKTGEQGILDYRLTISYDTATRRLTQVLALGFDQQARDGWVNFDFGPLGAGPLGNTLGSLLVFLPLLTEGLDSAIDAEGNEAIANIVLESVGVAIATTLGLTGMLNARRITLFGIELSATELLPDNQAEESTRFGVLSALFDYAVDFVVDINVFGLLTIQSKRIQSPSDPNTLIPIPIRVRYRGLGVRFNFQDPHTFEAIFDTSKGFELGLADPGSLFVGGPLGPILRVDSVRLGRQNPLILEMDLGLNANLGVVSVDSVRVRIPIEPLGTPTIIPTGISVNIPAAIVGSGFLDIRDGGFTGAIDITLVPVKLRIQASVGLESLEDGDRRITAFFLGLGVEFPAPVPLASTGLGLYGLLGLFGMHYKRDEEPPVNANLPIALDWYFSKAKGEPHLIAVDGRRTWLASPDRWSFGLGVVVGTMEGAFVLNLKGMLVLELPGPRILIFVKAQILKVRPPTGKPVEERAGLLAAVDVNIPAGYIAIGLIINYEIKDLLRMEVPIDSRFNVNDIDDWHFYIGSLANKASAVILGIAKGTAYLMFDGKGIQTPIADLHGFSIAAGIAASLVLGDEDSGLYAKVSGALDVAVSIDPLHFFGRMTLEGSIHLWCVDLGASAKLNIEAPEPLYVQGEVCGSIDLWFTEIEGCVGITIGDPQPLPIPEELVIGLSLQSHSPALLEGQGTDQPIDTALGISHRASETVQNMPLDVIPVLQMKYPPLFAADSAGLEPLSSVPTLPPDSDGWFSLGGVPGQEGDREVRYEIKSITISPPLPGGIVDLPTTWWQPARPQVPTDSQATDKSVNLALNSWIPFPFPRAYQRSQEQRQTIRNRFEVICGEIAPATRVLWTFNAHFIPRLESIIRILTDPYPGPSANGWRLNGTAWPDPPNTQRTHAPSTRLHIHEADYPYRTNPLMQQYAAKLTGYILDSARVIPDNGGIEDGQVLQLPFLQFAPGLQEDNLVPEIREAAQMFLEQAGDRERIVVESGDVTEVRALICTNRRHKVVEFVRLRGFDADNNLVEEIAAPAQLISGSSDLPAQWTDPDGPWASDVRRVLDFFQRAFEVTHEEFLVEWLPQTPIARFEIVYVPEESFTSLFQEPPAVMLGVVETLTRAEMEREIAQQHYQEDMVEVVVKSLEEGDKRPLFAPNETYTVSINYVGAIRKSNKPSEMVDKQFTQEFTFRTVVLPPERLNPWVLATVPESDADTHFTEDKVQIIFNDAATIQLFKAFGRTLRVVLRKANGNHPPHQPLIDLNVLQPVKASLLTPYALSMHELVVELPCVPVVIETEQHQVFSVDIPLERGTSYMLDIESSPASEEALTPLFRTAFSTSRFISASELAGLVLTSYIRERAARSAPVVTGHTQTLVVPDDTTASHTAPRVVHMASDAEVESALLEALGSDIPPPQQPGVTLLWSGAAPARLSAVLIDAPESILRTRPVPVEVKTPTPDEDIIQHFQAGQQLWLEIAETGSGVVDRIVYATGGCRALVFIKDGAAGSLQLALRQYRHTLLTAEPVMQDFELVSMPLPAQAPWEV